MLSKPTDEKLEKKIARLEKQLERQSSVQQRMLENKDWDKLFIDSAPYGMMVHDKKGKVLVFNPQLEKISGYHAKEIDTIFTWIEKVYPEGAYRKLVLAERKKAFLHKGPRVMEAVITRKTGEKRHCQFSSFGLASGLRIVFIQDIEDQKQVKVSLQESEERFRLLAEASFEAIIIHREGVLLNANTQFFDMFDYTPVELIGKQIIPAIIAPESIESVQEKIRSGNTDPYEAKGRKKNNVSFPIIIHAKSMQYHGHTVRVAAIRNLSYQKKAEETEKSFQTMINDIPALICRFLPDGTLTFVNERYCDYFHKNKKELIDHNFFQFIPAEDRPKVKKHFTSLNQKHPMTTYEHKVITPDGTIHWQRWTDRALFDARKKIYAYQSIGIDITDWKTAESALRESEEKFRTVTEKSPNMIFIYKDNRIVYCNQQCEKMIQFSRDQFCALEFDFLSIIAPESADKLISNFNNQLNEKPVKAHEYTLVARDGKQIAVIITAKRIHYEGGKAILGIVTDITEQRQTEKNLREKDRELQRQALSLQETNTALKVLIDHREKEKIELEENILTNVQQLILPYVARLEHANLSGNNEKYLATLKANLKELVSSFASTMSSEYIALTPSELQVANLIKQGKTSKEIAVMLNVTVKAVSFHRGNIRKKLSLSNKKANLRSHLQSFPPHRQ